MGVLAAAAAVFIPGASADSVKAQTFELEGNIAQDHPAAPTTYDWANFFDPAGAKLPLPTGYTASVFVPDFRTTNTGAFDTSDASTFTIGSKDTLDVAGWSCTPANNVTDKGDIMNAYATTFTGADGHKFAYFALERNANTGDANVAFWFLEGGASCPGAGGSFVGNHHDGDLLVVSAFTKGGTVSTIDAYRWNGGAGGSLGTTPIAHGVDCKSTTSSADPTCATSNTAAISNIPWLTNNKTDGVGHKLQAGEFFEGGIDLTPLHLDNACFNTVMADTRSSQSLVATLYDYALGNLGECHSTTTTTPVDATNHGNAPASTIPSAPADAKVTVQDRTVVGTTGAPSTFNSSNSTNLTWHICGPTALTSTQLCDGTTGNVGVAVGSAAITAAGTFYSPTVTLTEAGRYCFRADFAGDSSIGLPGSSDSSANECFTVAPVQPTLSTNATSLVRVGSTLDDTATLGGTANEQGTGGPAGSDGSVGTPPSPVTLGGPAQGSITFTLWSPNSTTHCGTALGTSTISVSGNGGYTASNGTTKTGSFTPSAPGTYYWTASYTGDLPNTKSTDDACNGAHETSVVVDARIHISPSATNRVGQSHTFTVLVEKNLGDGAGWVPAGSEPVTVTLTNALGAHYAVSTNTCTAGTDATGKCAIVFTSPDPGTVTGHASSTLSDLGTPSAVTVQTDGTGQNGSDAVKTFVDARIHISPSATNRVGQSHTFTVLVEKNLGDGAGWVPAGSEPVTVTLTNGNGAHYAVSSNTCTSGTDASGHCSVTFTSPDPGTVTGDASSTLSDLGTPSAITVQTDGTGQNGSDAVKHFVDARIHISPSATNRVGQSHTFTVLVEKNLGDGAGWVPAAGEPVTGTLTNGNGAHFAVSTNTCTSGTDATGKCAVTFTSPEPGTVTGHASSTLSDLGTASPVTVATDGTGQNGSDAVKTFVDARIHISPSATNRVGQSHTFTVLVEKNLGDGAGWVAAGGEPVTVTLTNGLGAHFAVSSNTCTAGTDASGHCSVTFTSPDPGTVTGHASSTLSDLGTPSAITVQTDGAGQNGSDAVKTFVNAKISITPNATNGITEPHTFTVHIETDNGSGGGFVPAAGLNPTVTLTPAGGAVVSGLTDSCASTGTNASGNCGVTFTSNSAGTVTGHASIQLTLAGLTFTIATDGTGLNSGDAVKTFVQGSLTWIKHDGGGNLLGGATFQVCATGGTAASAGHTPACVTVVDNTTAETGGTYLGNDANPHLGQFELDKYQSFGSSALGGLALGTYTIQETVPPAGYTLDSFVETVMIDQSHLNVSATHIWVDTTPGQGCTPGFWKNHTTVWNSTSDPTVSHLLPFFVLPFGYNAALSNFNNQPFFGYSNPTAPPAFLPGIFGLVTSGPSNAIGPTGSLSSSLTLIGALNLGGGGFQALARHATAALLSSGSVQYPYTPTEVLNGVRNAFLANNPNQVSPTFPNGLLTDLENANNLSEQACPTS